MSKTFAAKISKDLQENNAGRNKETVKKNVPDSSSFSDTWKFPDED